MLGVRLIEAVYISNLVRPHIEAVLIGDEMKLDLIFAFLECNLYQKSQKEGYARVFDTLSASSLITWFASITGHASMFILIEKYALFVGAVSFVYLASYLRREIL